MSDIKYYPLLKQQIL